MDLRARLLSAAAALSLLAPAGALAQVPCPAPDNDAFALARRSRRVVADYERLHALHREDLARNDAHHRAQVGAPMPFSFGLAGVVDWQQTFGFDVCTEQGPWTGTLQPLLLGAVATVDLNRWRVGLEGFALLVQDRLTASPTLEQTRTPEGGFREPTGLATAYQSQTFLGGRVTFADWATVVAGHIRAAPVENVTGEDGRRLLVGPTEPVPPGRLYLGAGVPRYHLHTHLLFDARDVRPDQLELTLRDVPLPYAELLGSAGLLHLADEGQVILHLALRQVFGFLSADVAFEHRPARLRHARLRAEWDTSFGGALPPPVERPEDAVPRLAFDLGAFAELSWFGSRWLEERTGSSSATGAYFGAFARPDVTLLMARLDLYFGVNRPEELSRLSEARGHWQMGVRMHGRFGL